MDNHIARIQQNPIALRFALGLDAAITGFFQSLADAMGDRGDVAIGATGGHDHRVGNRGPALEVNDYGLFGLGILDGVDDQRKIGLAGKSGRRGDDRGG